MTHSFVRVYIHLVWHTKYRQPQLEGRLEEFVLGELRNVFDEADLVTAAVNAAWDHVHTLVGWRADLSLGEVIQQAKGRSAYHWNNQERGPGDPELAWQRGYGAISVSPDRIDRVIGYIDAQKRRHGQGDIIPRYERVEHDDDGEWGRRW